MRNGWTVLVLAWCMAACAAAPEATAEPQDQMQLAIAEIRQVPARNILQLPPGADVGTWWERRFAGVERKERYAVTGRRKGLLVVESAIAVGGVEIIKAWAVDPNVDLTRAVPFGGLAPVNVREAWVGVAGQAPRPRLVRQPAKVEPVATTEHKDFEQGVGVDSVELAGRFWDCSWRRTSEGRTWMAAGSAFPVKQEVAGRVTLELTGCGNGATPMLAWQ